MFRRSSPPARHPVRPSSLVATALALLLTACWSLDDNPAPAGDADAAEDEAPDPWSDVPMGSMDDLSGTWGWSFALTYTTLLPVLNREATLLLTGYAVSEVEHEGLAFAFNEKICRLNMEVVEFPDEFKISFPDATVNSAPVADHVGHLGALEEGAAFSIPPSVNLFGLHADRFDDVFNDPLPTEADDLRVWDMDDDGKPGVTAKINGWVQGEVYVALRLMRMVDGEVIDANHIAGFNDSEAAMEVLDASDEFLLFDMDLAVVNNPALNHFELTRLHPGTGCATLIETASRHFSYDPHAYLTPAE